MSRNDQQKTINNLYQSFSRDEEDIDDKFQSAIILRSSHPILFDKTLLSFTKNKYEDSSMVYGEKYNLLGFFVKFYKHDGVASVVVGQFINYLRDSTSIDLQVCSMYIPMKLEHHVELKNDDILKPLMLEMDTEFISHSCNLTQCLIEGACEWMRQNPGEVFNVPTRVQFLSKSCSITKSVIEVAYKLISRHPDEVLAKLKTLNLSFNYYNRKIVITILTVFAESQAQFIQKVSDILKQAFNIFAMPINDNEKLTYKVSVYAHLLKKLSECDSTENIRNYIKLIEVLHIASFLTQSDIVDGLEILSTSANEEEQVEQSLLPFVETFRKIFEPETLTEKHFHKIRVVQQYVESYKRKTTSDSLKKKFKRVLRLINLSPNSEKDDEDQKMTDGLTFLIETLEKNENIHELPINPFCKNPFLDAVRFLDVAFRSLLTAQSFAKGFKAMIDFKHVGSQGIQFKNCVFLASERTFKKQASSKGYCDDEIFITMNFFSQLIELEVLPMSSQDFFIHHLLGEGNSHETCMDIFINSLLRVRMLSKYSRLKEDDMKIIPGSEKAFALYGYKLKAQLNPPFTLTVPLEKDVVEKYLIRLFKKGVSDQDFHFEIIETFIETCSKVDSHFQLSHLKKLLQSLANAEFRRINQRDERTEYRINFCAFIVRLATAQLIAPSGIVNIWATLTKHFLDHFDDLWMCIKFINQTKSLVKHCDDRKTVLILKEIPDKLKEHEKSINSESNRMELEDFFSYYNSITKDKKKPTVESKSAPASSITIFDEFASILSSTFYLHVPKLEDIIDRLESTDQALRKFVKVYFDFVKHDENVRNWTMLINSKMETKFNSELSFKKIITTLTINNIKKIPKMNHIDDPQEITQTIGVLRVTAELYNIGWIEEGKLISCMDKLSANNFETNHQLEMFHMLLKLVYQKMTKNKHVGKCRRYRDILTEDNNAISLETQKKRDDVIKMLEKVVTVNRIEDPIEDGNFFEAFRDENIEEFAKLVSKILMTNRAEVMIERLIEKASNNPKLFAKLSQEIDKLSPFSGRLMKKCFDEFKTFSIIHEDREIIKLCNFVGELYNFNVATDDMIHDCIRVLLDIKSTSDNVIVSCCALIATVGAKMETSDSKHQLNKYFNYFKYLVESNNVRKDFFKSLIELRKNKWHAKEPTIDDESAKILIVEQINQLSENEVPEIAIVFIKCIKNIEVAKFLIEKTWEIVIKKPELIEKCCSLLSVILGNIQDGVELNKLLANFMRARFDTFMSLPNESFNDKIKQRLEQVMYFVATLNKFEVASDDLVAEWLDEKLLKQLTMVDLSKLSFIMASKIFETESLKLKMLLLKLEDEVKDKLKQNSAEMRNSVKRLIDSKINYLIS